MCLSINHIFFTTPHTLTQHLHIRSALLAFQAHEGNVSVWIVLPLFPRRKARISNHVPVVLLTNQFVAIEPHAVWVCS
jgi:hypothetical protein